jgi:SAM-dependent methyltransferase
MNQYDGNNPLSILKNIKFKKFILDRSLYYGRLTGLPSEWLPGIIETLYHNSDEPELAIKKIHQKFPGHLLSGSDYQSRLRKYRFRKIKILAARLRPHLKGPVMLDFGGQTADLFDEVEKGNPDIEKFYVTGINKDESLPGGSKHVEFLTQPCLYATPLSSDCVDTIILSLVMHHIACQEDLLKHLAYILKPAGRIILIEDSYPENYSDPDADEIIKRFFSFNEDYKFGLLSFFDWQGNRITRSHPAVPMVYNYKTMEKWQRLFNKFGFTTKYKKFIGKIDNDQIDLLSPKAFFVFEIPDEKNRYDNISA